MVGRYRREWSVALAILLLGLVLAIVAPAFFATGNLVDMLLANVPVLLVAVGMTMVMVTGEIDISVGSVFAICGVVAGALATWDVPVVFAALAAPVAGFGLGALNGALVAHLRLPSIVVTLATMVLLRDSLRWVTQGAWIQNLPDGFQWFGLPQQSYPVAAAALAFALAAMIAWSLRNLQSGRAIYAVGSNAEAARLSAIEVVRTRFFVFAAAGALTGLAAVINAVRFNQIPSNAGVGLEMKVIAAVVVGGTAITGGRGTIGGTVLGVALLGMIGPGLTFLGASASWERALQGLIILSAVGLDAVRGLRAARRSSASPEGPRHAVA
jgi:rhamnose transport system permease protein